MNTDWTIVIPGRGKIFATQIGRDARQWLEGESGFGSTVGRGADGRGAIVGRTQGFQASLDRSSRSRT
jgi:hypothetical protein